MIYYGLCGEGRGHASRFISISEMFPEQEFTVFTHKTGYSFIADYLRNTRSRKIRLVMIDGFEFFYNKGKVSGFTNPFKAPSILKNNNFIFHKHFNSEVSLVVTDWEFSISRFAKKQGLPCISLDNQHKFRFGNFEKLEFDYWDRVNLAAAALLCPITIPYCTDYIVCTFSDFNYDIHKNVNWCAIIPSKDIEENKNNICNNGSTVGYFLNATFESIRSYVPKDCVLYSEQPIDGFKFRPLNRQNFIQDLVRCDKVISTAGNTLISEALYLGKKIEVFPIKNHFEQKFNKLCLDEHGDKKIYFEDTLIKSIFYKYL